MPSSNLNESIRSISPFQPVISVKGHGARIITEDGIHCFVICVDEAELRQIAKQHFALELDGSRAQPVILLKQSSLDHTPDAPQQS